MNILAITHGRNDGPGIFRDELERAGHQLEEWHMFEGCAPVVSPEDYDAVITLGGDMSAYDDAEYPWLRDECSILRALLKRRVPTLGICLGAQVLARAFNGRVYETPEPEIGFVACQLTRAGQNDPVLGALPDRFHAFDWHKDTWETPRSAVELARTERCSQALRIGDTAWAVQFHPEIERSAIALALRESPIDPERSIELTQSIDEQLGEWHELGRRLCRAFTNVASAIRTRGGGPN